MNRVVLFFAVLTLFPACMSRGAKTTVPQAVDHVGAGIAALEANDLDRAEAEFHVALEYDHEMPEAFNGLGIVAMRRNDYVAAQNMFKMAVLKRDEFAEGHANLGAVQMEMRHPDHALPHLRAALDIDPGFLPARHNMARALRRLGRLTEAREEYMKLTSIAPEDAESWAALAHVELSLGNRAAAGRANRKALDINAEQPLALQVKASILRDGGDLKGALDIYDVLVRAVPSDAELLVDRSVTRLLLGRTQEALADAERAVSLAAHSLSAHFAHGLALVESHSDRDAVAAFDRALALARERKRSYPRAAYFRAGALQRLGRRKEAKVAYSEFLKDAKGKRDLEPIVAQAKKELRALESKRGLPE